MLYGGLATRRFDFYKTDLKWGELQPKGDQRKLPVPK